MGVIWRRLCKYDLRKGNLFVLRWARVRRVRRGSISSELLICGGSVRSIFLLPLVARCRETIDVCIYMAHACFYVCWNVCCVAAVVKDSVFFSSGVLYVCVKGVMDVVISICIVTRGAVGARVWEVGVFRHADMVLCVHPVAVVNAEFCMTCSLLMLVEDARGDHIEEAYFRAGLMTAL